MSFVDPKIYLKFHDFKKSGECSLAETQESAGMLRYSASAQIGLQNIAYFPSM